MQIIDSGSISCHDAMAKDAYLLESVKDKPILHLYSMQGRAATYGHFTKPGDFLNLPPCEEEGIQLAKRPTGGGIIFHFLDYAFSYLAPKGHPLYSDNVMENYRAINSLVMKGLKTFFPNKEFTFLDKGSEKISSFCMAHPTPYDILCDGKKSVGAAQRKTRQALLHQGSISLLAPPVGLLNKILNPAIAELMLKNSFYITEDPQELPSLRKALQEILIINFR